MAAVSGDLRCERMLWSPVIAHRWFWVLCAPRCESYLWRRTVRTLGCQILFAVVVVCAMAQSKEVLEFSWNLSQRFCANYVAAEDFASEKLLRYFGIRRQIESFPARIVYSYVLFLSFSIDNCGCCYHNKCLPSSPGFWSAQDRKSFEVVYLRKE